MAMEMRLNNTHGGLRPLVSVIVLLLVPMLLRAQDADGSNYADAAASTQKAGSPSPKIAETTSETGADSMFPHFKDGPFWLSGQINFIFQTHPPFHAKYTGTNSLLPVYEKATSRVMTLFTGVRLDHSTEILFDLEEAGGEGLSQALGVAGFPNLDVVRNPTLSKSPYVARLMFHKVIRLSKEEVESERGPLSLFTELPARRLEVRVGKFGMVDFFDLNAVGNDSHLQFMNWAVDQNGAYDFAADTRGYTWGVFTEYQDRKWAFRFAEGLMPKVANGIDLQWNLRRAHAENFELEVRRGLLPNKAGTIRLLSYQNYANMGRYREAINRFLAGIDPVPDITAHPLQTTRKYGFGVNLEQSLTPAVKLFGRFGWNNGKTESFAYTEIDQTAALGVGFDGAKWGRKKDRAGVAFASNAISGDHRRYLALGGRGFIIGDGALNYGREQILEGYYTVHVWKGIYVAPGLQYITNPAYNRDRGPVLIPIFRFHLEL
jgi:high affinity Mn2+ porin